MKRNLALYTAIAVMISAMSCDRMDSPGSDYVDKTKDWTEVVTMVVSSELGTVYGMEGIPSEGMKAKEEGKKDWNPFYFWEIEGFDYILGFEYRLKVEKTHIVDPPQDAPSIEYKLIKILSEEFKLDDGYVMTDDYYQTASYPVTRKQDEYYLIIAKSEKSSALSYLAGNGFAIMENSEEGTGTFYRLKGQYEDCFQLTVKGTGALDMTPGVIYSTPLYNDDAYFKTKTFGRSNVIQIRWPSRWENEKKLRYQKYIQRYAEVLNLEYIGWVSNGFEYGVTNASSGNAVQIANWFTSLTEAIVDISLPENAPVLGM